VDAEIRVKISKKTHSARGEAEFLELMRYLEPYDDAIIYFDEKQLH
jgi:hypothetical protein